MSHHYEDGGEVPATTCPAIKATGEHNKARNPISGKCWCASCGLIIFDPKPSPPPEPKPPVIVDFHAPHAEPRATNICEADGRLWLLKSDGTLWCKAPSSFNDKPVWEKVPTP